MSHDNRSRVTVELGATSLLHGVGNLPGWEQVGLVTVGAETGALVVNKRTGTYAMCHGNSIRTLDQRKIKAALGISNNAGRPALPDNELAKTRAIRLSDAHYAKLKHLGMDWLRQQIDRAKEPPK